MSAKNFTDSTERSISLFEKLFIKKREKEFSNEAARFEERNRVRRMRPRLLAAIPDAEFVLEIMSQNLRFKGTDICLTLFNSYKTSRRPLMRLAQEILTVPMLCDNAERLVELAKTDLNEAKKALASFDKENAAILSEIAVEDAALEAEQAAEQAAEAAQQIAARTDLTL